VSLNRQEKAIVIEEVTTQVATAQSIVVAEYRGLDVASVTVLRKTARESGVYLRVLKNSLARRAVAGTPFEALSDKLVGPLIYGISADPVNAAKVLSAFAKDNDKLVIKAGALPNSLLDVNGVKAPCKLRLRNLYVLLTKFRLSSCAASRLCVIKRKLLNATHRNFVKRQAIPTPGILLIWSSTNGY
jgi:large subunit ribosomal protein L10